MGPHRRAALVLLAVLFAGCSPSTGTSSDAEVPPTPEVAGTWEELPAAPLLPRGGTQALWTGSEVVFWGGQAVDPNAEPCPPNALCTGPDPGPEAQEAAAYDPSTGTWRPLTGTPPTYGQAQWTQGRIVDSSTSYDLATQTSTTLPWHDLLVYAQAQVVGSDLVVVGWDYGLGELDGVGQVAAASLDLTDPVAQWRQVEWPLPPPGAENVRTATDGTELLVVVWVGNPEICDTAGHCYRMLRFAPSSGTWTELSPERIPNLSSGHGHVLGTLDEEAMSGSSTTSELVTVDPADGSIVSSNGDVPAFANVLVSPAGQLAVVSDRARIRVDDRWQPLPPVPGDPTGVTYVWAGEELIAWGGNATAGDPDSRNSADGFVFRPA